MELDMDGARRLLAHLPCWRAPEVAQAWSEHEESAAPGSKSVTAVTVDELAQRIADHDPHYTGADIPATLEQLAADGLAVVDEAGGWAQSQAGMDLLTGGGAQAHSDHVAAIVAAETAAPASITGQEAPDA